MSQPLPTHITSDMHPYLIKLIYAYRQYKPLDTDTELTPQDIKKRTYVGIKGLTEQCGLEYNKEMNKRR